MMYRKIAKNLRLDSGATGQLLEVESASKMLGEVLLPVMTIEDSGAAEWTQVDVYTVAKPF